MFTLLMGVGTFPLLVPKETNPPSLYLCLILVNKTVLSDVHESCRIIFREDYNLYLLNDYHCSDLV